MMTDDSERKLLQLQHGMLDPISIQWTQQLTETHLQHIRTNISLKNVLFASS
jgi:hypothetical protein